MSSGQWEVVGKSKKDKGNNNNKKLTKNEKKKLIENAPKVEDILPIAQVKTLYSALDKSNKDSSQKQIKENKSKENETKKQVQKKVEKKQEPPKPKPPKSLESALNAINVNDLKSILEVGKQRFPEAPLIWLKDLAVFLNSRTAVENIDPVFSNKGDGYPLNVLPSGVRQVIDKAVKDAGRQNAQTFFDICLAAMTNDMAKGVNVIGYKIFLQYLTLGNPNVAVANLNKSLNAWNSYQNRQPIGLSILWALGQANIRDFNVGLKVFQDFMLPILEMKNYSRYIVTYTSQLLKRCPNKMLTANQFLYLFDVINAPKLNVSRDLLKELFGLNSVLKKRLFDDRTDGNYHQLIEPLFQRLSNAQTNPLKKEIIDTLVQCLINDSQQSYATWKTIYGDHILSSATLLTYINSSWKQLNTKFNNKHFKELMKSFDVINSGLVRDKKNTEGLQEAARSTKALTEKMTVKKSFPWFKITFLLSVITTGLLVWDSQKHGSFEASNTGQFLKDIGAWKHGETAFKHASVYAGEGRKWLEEHGPVYVEATKEYLKPYRQLARDLGVVTLNHLNDLRSYAAEKTPIVLAKVEEYAPGLVGKVSDVSIQCWEVTRDFSVHYYGVTKDYLATQVFVGQLSPENLQKATLEALNTTQVYAAQYYDWVCQKVQLLANSKVQ